MHRNPGEQYSVPRQGSVQQDPTGQQDHAQQQFPYQQQATQPNQYPQHNAAPYQQQATQGNQYPQQNLPPYQGQQQPPVGPAGSQVRLTRDQYLVVRQCYKECFWQRAFPLSLAGGGLTYFLHKTGRFPFAMGRNWAIFGAGFTAYMLGMVSCGRKCREVLLQSDATKQANQQLYQGPYLTRSPESGYQSGGVYQQPGDQSDMYQNPDFVGAGSNMYGGDAPYQQNAPGTGNQPVGAPTATYDDLRAKNREAFYRQQQGRPANPQQGYANPDQPNPNPNDPYARPGGPGYV